MAIQNFACLIIKPNHDASLLGLRHMMSLGLIFILMISGSAHAATVEAILLSDSTTEQVQTGYSLNPALENLEYWFEINNVTRPDGTAIDVINDQTQFELFRAHSSGTLEVEYLGVGYAAFHSPFGLFTYSGNPYLDIDAALMNYHQPLFIQNETTEGSFVEVNILADTWFGFYLNVNGGGTMLSTLNATNPGGLDNVLIFETNLGYTLAFEDIPGGGDRDYEDLVVNIRSVSAVPLPAAVWLFVGGLFPIALRIRRRAIDIHY